MTIAPVTREGPRDCPHCEEMTMANRLPDGSLVCSCPAMRPLPGGFCLEHHPLKWNHTKPPIR